MKPTIVFLLLLLALTACKTHPPSRPARAAATQPTVTLAWDPSVPTNATVQGYRVDYGPDSYSRTNSVDALTNLTVAVPVDLGLTNYFVVSAYGSSGGTNIQSVPSNEIAYAIPGPSSNVLTLMITALEPTSVSLAWTDSNPVGIAGYTLQFWPGDHSTLYELCLPATMHGLLLDWLIQPNTDYYFTIASADSNGVLSAWSAIVSCHTPITVLPAPANLRILSAPSMSGPWAALTNVITITNFGGAQFYQLEIK